ncbi:FAD-dependent thymidylate synthase [Helicobacter kayseriensis]|uniref:FAD-dependent thymidylate synthase n=1 Tax=Helicobacter kayseriensis TaxID=2905877 RepID=UPI001E43DD4D|nr:FAD-dependent thymidylate synthase [Helicobacter kayseriensis]MCE3047150.1 FAD-dependent thymidylate synthase [Helicobacter kayseriensis]MCE3048521.1 FAD-dependent thymidylate synthase [Helicobacter kayseriensis]
MRISLLFHTPLSICVQAGRTCWQSQERGGCYTIPTDEIIQADKDFLDRILNKHKHGSVAEHLTYNFAIEGISRACLQELARHRHASLSVKSSRYTLKELKSEEDVVKNASKYLVMSGNQQVDEFSIQALKNLQTLLLEGISNDLAKYAMPESYKTSLAWSVNARALQNFLILRSSKAALWEIRELAFALFEALPKEHRFLFEGVMNNEGEEK